MIAVRRLLKKKKYLTFVLGDGEYAFDVLRVEEILPLRKVPPIDPVHNAPQCFKGVATLRGRPASVISARVQLGLGEGVETSTTCLILTTLAGDIQVGWIVDRVRDIINVDVADIEPPPFPSDGGRVGALGLVKRGERATIILDIEELLESSPPVLSE